MTGFVPAFVTNDQHVFARVSAGGWGGVRPNYEPAQSPDPESGHLWIPLSLQPQQPQELLERLGR